MGFLDGLRVLDLTDERGLLAGRMLADLGADVVAVEPPGGSTARVQPPRTVGGGSYCWEAFAANKRGVVADLETADGRQRVLHLAEHADFLIESAPPGRMAELGLDWPDLHLVNPALVYVSITAFGRTGPKAGYAESDLVVWAAGGPLDPHRDGVRPPVRISVPQAYLHAAADAAGGALFAHLARRRTGRGQHVDVSAQASLGIATLGQVLAEAVGDSAPEWERPVKRVDQSGSGSGTDASQKKWPCRDGLVEFHIGMGPAVGAFTSAFFRWMAEESWPVEEWANLDWRGVPAMLADGTFTEDDLLRARDVVAAFFVTKTKQEVLEAASGRKLLCVPIYDTGDVLTSRQLAARAFWADLGEGDRRVRLPGRWAEVSADAFSLRRPAPLLGEHTEEVGIEWAHTAPRRADPADSRDVKGPAPKLPDPFGDQLRPLQGLKVLDFSWVVAGPIIGRALADFGATVVRVESSKRIETARHMPPYHDGKAGRERSALYLNCNAGKYGMSLDLSSAEGRGVASDLARWADVVIESYAPGRMRQWGLDYATLAADRPDLIMVSTSLNGQTGPYAQLAGYGNVGAALSGFQDVVGWPDRLPFGPFGPYTDYVGPRFSLAALLAALDERARTGKGCYIDVSQVETGVVFQSPEMADCAASGTVVERRGNRDRLYAPHGVYPCVAERGRDRFVAIAVTGDEQWVALARAMDRPDLADDADLAAVEGRRRHEDRIDKAIDGWTQGQQADDVEAQLQALGVAAHRSASSRDVCLDPQLLHRGHLVRLPHPVFTTTTVEGPRYLLSETPGQVQRPAPTIGQDNEWVLTQLLGYEAGAIASLREAGALV